MHSINCRKVRAVYPDSDQTRLYKDSEGNSVEIPVPKMADAQAFDQNAAQDTHFINFNIFAGGNTELEYLRHIGVLDADFNPVSAQALNLSQYLQQSAQQSADANALVSVRGPQAITGNDGNSYVPADVALPYTVSFANPTEAGIGQLRLVSEIDADLDIRTLRLGDLKLGDINIHLPADRTNFQGDFDFTGSKGFILRVSAGIDASTRIATWLLQTIDPDTGEVLQDNAHGLLLPAADATVANAGQLKKGFVSYTVRAADTAPSKAEIVSSARIFVDAAPPIDSAKSLVMLDAKAPSTALAVTSLGNNAQGASSFDLSWTATDDDSGVKSVTGDPIHDRRHLRFLRQRHRNFPSGRNRSN